MDVVHSATMANVHVLWGLLAGMLILGCSSDENEGGGDLGGAATGGTSGGSSAGGSSTGGSSTGGSSTGGSSTGGSSTGGSSTGGSSAGGSSAGGSSTGGSAAAPQSDDCASVRLTQYTSSDRRWCGFDRNHEVLPDFVRQGMTIAIAEPYNGSSYGGDPGEACGECWELDTTFGTQIVMVHNLCPTDGNPVCNGSHFHFDVSNEVASVIDGGGWMGEAQVRRVPCPVTGNIHAYISDRNQWGYLKLAFFNHRFPIRTVEYQPTGESEWVAMERCLARWCVPDDDKSTFAESGPGAVFRLTSGAGEVIEGTEVLTYAAPAESVFDIGTQFAPADPQGGACVFVPPADVYDEQWGGIEGVRWEPNTWGSTNLAETGTDCADGSPSCVSLDGFQGSGLHITYRHIFPLATFSRLKLQLRAASGGGEVEVAPRTEESRCDQPTTVTVGSEWVEVDIDVAASCPGVSDIHGLTISRASDAMDLVVDEVRFE